MRTLHNSERSAHRAPCVNTPGMSTATIFSPTFSYAENQQFFFFLNFFFLNRVIFAHDAPGDDLRCFSNNSSFHSIIWLYTCVHRLYLYHARACRSIFPQGEESRATRMPREARCWSSLAIIGENHREIAGLKWKFRDRAS